MIGIGIAATIEWEAVLKYYDVNESEIKEYPFWFYFKRILNNRECIFYKWTWRKVISSSAQYMIEPK